MNNVTLALRNELNMSKKSLTSESNSGESDSAANDIEESEEKIETVDFVDNMPPPPIRDELQPIDYFYFLFGKRSTTLLTNQPNLYAVQKNPNKPIRISETEMEHFIGILLMTGIYSFPKQRYFWSSDTRVESISSVMSRDRFLEIKKYLRATDNSVQSNRTDINFDRANKVHPLLNIVKENFRKISKEEK
ncbi:unnamed protein product [Rotaria sordida]|uniref:PiggyBac transposable element-derived protein domain-containing protein n=1 Tax=Rotaria sordida TaxID=392033 RepID=A0A819XNQ2_9BILA|nr:unnamed protein product [Rotaria sordida]CAF4139509.1 unnamed protein product [Rotaria sordida]